jgi:hypothetical protein
LQTKRSEIGGPKKAERFRAESNPQQVKRLGDELGRLVFGE